MPVVCLEQRREQDALLQYWRGSRVSQRLKKFKVYYAVHGQLDLKRSKRTGDVQADTKEAGICGSKRGHDNPTKTLSMAWRVLHGPLPQCLKTEFMS